ncbi:MAG: preprotein translocase subunit YajC [Candidatus Liberibacter ctenarytainae]|uniref:Sec translocon accessory complex subunit YajC n=1 Tax=Candidatus Liberibacter ctenarytainae TaxID=2020335 RepID=A0A937AKC6_9HYPH|nr:preprotein translocase subunit YajC [Candidatus Liberibacter ctenarytainae]
MIFTTAYAQSDSAPVADSVVSTLEMIVLFVILASVWYFLLIRPQRQQFRRREEVLNNLRRGDSVITSAGIIGKITKVLDNSEVEVEICDGVRIRMMRSFISEIRSQSEPVIKKSIKQLSSE